jgi:MoaA/NifB/PqqE/SkfB family radical SAM enzyme
MVLDTSGVGELDMLLPTLKKCRVHVRVSLDAVGPENEKTRPINTDYVRRGVTSKACAQETIRVCLSEGLALTVQTVVSSMNEDISKLRAVRDWLVFNNVRHWVLHITVKGGSARRIEAEAVKEKRSRGILPSPRVYEQLRTVIREAKEMGLPLDIRCTDTDTSPNSVLLVASDGNLYTEGSVPPGKQLLFDSSHLRPDMLQGLWRYVDRIGHARRYLNWNPKISDGETLKETCYRVPLPVTQPVTQAQAPSGPASDASFL